MNAPIPPPLEFPWAAPPAPGEAIAVADGLLWIRMPLPFALDHINLWLARESDGRWTAIDCGYGNAATRLGDFAPSEGTFARGGDPDVDALFKQQARETDRKKREQMLGQIQQLIYERARFGPMWEYIWPSGIGPRVGDAMLLKIDPYPWSAPYEDVTLKK